MSFSEEENYEEQCGLAGEVKYHHFRTSGWLCSLAGANHLIKANITYFSKFRIRDAIIPFSLSKATLMIGELGEL